MMCYLCPLDQLYGRRRLALLAVGVGILLLLFSAGFEHSWKHVCAPANSSDATQSFRGVYTDRGAYDGFDIRHYIQTAAVVVGTATFLISATLWGEVWDEHFLRLRLVVVISMSLFTGCLLMGEIVIFCILCDDADVYPRGYWLDVFSMVFFIWPSAVFFAELCHMCSTRRTYEPLPI